MYVVDVITYSFVPSGLSDGRTPEASASYLRSTLFDDNPRAHEMLGAFAAQLFSHNTQIAILIFALGKCFAIHFLVRNEHFRRNGVKS